MYKFHKDKKGYFNMQTANANAYVIPFIEEKFTIHPGMRVLEIGCGEGGVLKAFINKGCTGVGVELNKKRVKNACLFMKDLIEDGKIKIISKDIYNVNIENDFDGVFDIIILKDVIEHIHNQEKLIDWMKSFLTPNGIIFFGFPPWYMPFGGHQQMCHSSLKKVPFIHLLPRSWYQKLLEKKNENAAFFLEIVDTQLSIERFEHICKDLNYRIQNKRHYFINPIYKWKFGLKPRKQLGIITKIPYLRNFITTCVYYTIQKKR